jgi:pimeloyl-ACP methyl ester carboxylesterase
VRDRSRLRSLTLISPAGIKVKGQPFSESYLWSPAETAANLFHDPAFAPPPAPMDDDALDLYLKNRTTAAKLGWAPRLINPDLQKWLHRLRLPVQIIWGAEDKLIPRITGDLWAASVPGSQLTVYEACGHLPHVEQCPAVAAKVLNFLKESGS